MDENPYKSPESADNIPPVTSRSSRTFLLGLAIMCYLVASIWVFLAFYWISHGDAYYAFVSMMGMVGFACLGFGLQRNRKRVSYVGFCLFIPIVAVELSAYLP
jgi:hypothetical protein